tara:strand:+ start:785 stop:1459 length:675 start_codon:yes stop_codon:yes gene_type:complete
MSETFVRSQIGRFAIVPLWVIEQADPQALRLYAILAGKYGDRKGESYPSRQRLAEQLNVSVKTVDRSILELQRIGALQVQHRTATDVGDFDTNLYTVTQVSPGSDKYVPTVETPVSLGVAPPVSPELYPVEPEPTNDTSLSLATKGKLTSVDKDSLFTEFAAQLGGAERVEFEIDRALNHRAARSWISQRRGVRNWLKKAVQIQGERPTSAAGARASTDGWRSL